MSLEIPITKQSETFRQHLNASQNERIIFSGIFGIGKSYFLKKYFDSEKEDYLAINLKPINYSISNNEDIFRLVKYDILYELIFTHELQLTFESIERKIAYGVLFGDKVPGLIEAFLPLIHLLNKDIPDVSPLMTFINKFAPNFKEAEKARKDVNENWRLLDFVKEIENTPILEFDFITTFIHNSLESLSTLEEQGRKKFKVLIIDDLDRIDPEHIFRLFNIFSAHLDYRNSTANKFGFDKVIFVCDIDNIRNIFAAKYGLNVDFSGYIDKFYSTEIFFFNNNEQVATITNTIIKSINFGRYQTVIKEVILHGNEESTTNLFYIILRACINSGSLSIRRIQSIYEKGFSFREKYFFTKQKQDLILNTNVPATIIYEILLWIFGDINSLERALQRLVKFGRSALEIEGTKFNHNLSNYLEMLIPIIDIPNHKFIDKEDLSKPDRRTFQAKIDSKAINLKYDLKLEKRRDFLIYYAEIDISTYKANSDKIELYEFVLEAFRVLKTIDYF